MELHSIYDLPVAGFGPGVHRFTYRIDREFFAMYAGAPIEQGEVTIALEVEKRQDGLTVTIAASGHMDTACDRCLAWIRLPLEIQQTFLYRYSSKDEKDDEVFFISPQTPVINVADHIYESVVLAIPIIKSYDCENESPRPCQFDVLNKIQSQEDQTGTTDESVWEILKNVQYDKN